MNVTTESSQLFPQLLITPLQWDLIFLRAVRNTIHNNGEVAESRDNSRSDVELQMSLEMSLCSCRCSVLCRREFLLPCSIHTLILSCMCVFTSVIFQSYFFFLSAVHLSSVARPKPIFASSWWQRGGDCQGGGPCLLGKRRYRDFHKALAAL